ncbi:hypothetical protein V1289_009753 [Bradyrhizobium sp. AZCC 2289]
MVGGRAGDQREPVSPMTGDGARTSTPHGTVAKRTGRHGKKRKLLASYAKMADDDSLRALADRIQTRAVLRLALYAAMPVSMSSMEPARARWQERPRSGVLPRCPLPGAQRKLRFGAGRSESDPPRTSLKKTSSRRVALVRMPPDPLLIERQAEKRCVPAALTHAAGQPRRATTFLNCAAL